MAIPSDMESFLHCSDVLLEPFPSFLAVIAQLYTIEFIAQTCCKALKILKHFSNDFSLVRCFFPKIFWLLICTKLWHASDSVCVECFINSVSFTKIRICNLSKMSDFYFSILRTGNFWYTYLKQSSVWKNDVLPVYQ